MLKMVTNIILHDFLRLKNDCTLECPVCLHPVKSPVTAKCGHTFCKECLKKAMERDPYCRTCKTPLRVITGTQPLGGSMKYTVRSLHYVI